MHLCSVGDNCDVSSVCPSKRNSAVVSRIIVSTVDVPTSDVCATTVDMDTSTGHADAAPTPVVDAPTDVIYVREKDFVALV